jgi:hypothetical protein
MNIEKANDNVQDRETNRAAFQKLWGWDWLSPVASYCWVQASPTAEHVGLYFRTANSREVRVALPRNEVAALRQALAFIETEMLADDVVAEMGKLT